MGVGLWSNYQPFCIFYASLVICVASGGLIRLLEQVKPGFVSRSSLYNNSFPYYILLFAGRGAKVADFGQERVVESVREKIIPNIQRKQAHKIGFDGVEKEGKANIIWAADNNWAFIWVVHMPGKLYLPSLGVTWRTLLLSNNYHDIHVVEHNNSCKAI